MTNCKVLWKVPFSVEKFMEEKLNYKEQCLDLIVGCTAAAAAAPESTTCHVYPSSLPASITNLEINSLFFFPQQLKPGFFLTPELFQECAWSPDLSLNFKQSLVGSGFWAWASVWLSIVLMWSSLVLSVICGRQIHSIGEGRQAGKKLRPWLLATGDIEE